VDVNGIVNFFGGILTPIRFIIEAILVGFHWIFQNVFHMDPAAGFTWVLSIVFLVLVVRAALIPIFVRQIKSQRKMMQVAPQLKKIQDKYKGKKDQFSREAMQRETMELYRKAGTNPLSSCLPLLIQMPIFFSLFSVLTEAREGKAGNVFLGIPSLLTKTLSQQFGSSSLFNIAPLKYSIQSALAAHPVQVVVVIIATAMVVIMTASQFITQLQLASKNQSPEMKASPMYRQQRVLLYILPLVFAFSGFAFPIGVMFYWLTSNIWTMVQQFLVIRNMPTPGSEAALAREARLAKRNRQKMSDDAAALGEPDAIEEPKKPVTTQRSQPVGKNRAKKTGSGKK
jgi:YidC/Oxa1 family membrane protein insertase